MRNFGYNLVKWWVKAGLHLYYGKIKISGLENVPKDKPVLFLPNHQNALLDVLLIGVDCNRKPFFLTRSDVFIGNFLNAVFSFFQMIPIYRIRDGREALKNNQAVFDTCADLLQKNNAILMFPEANHNVKRRVRQLSKGFTRILFNALEQNSDLDIQIIPVGINYRDSIDFPDKVALFFGKPILVKELYNATDVHGSVDSIKKAVSRELKQLTTHIADEANYDNIVNQLDALHVDYLNPKTVNEDIKGFPGNVGAVEVASSTKKNPAFTTTIFKGLFVLLNLPIVVVWKTMVKPKVWEPEFTGTLRFAFSMLAYPLYYAIVFGLVAWLFSPIIGLAAVFGLFLFNWVYVRFS